MNIKQSLGLEIIQELQNKDVTKLLIEACKQDLNSASISEE